MSCHVFYLQIRKRNLFKILTFEVFTNNNVDKAGVRGFAKKKSLEQKCYCSGMRFGALYSVKPRMHSSRMRTARLLTVFPSMHSAGGCLLLGGSGPGRVFAPGGRVCSRGVSQHALRQTPPCMDRMTDRCKNITLPQTSFAGGNKSLGSPIKSKMK